MHVHTHTHTHTISVSHFYAHQIVTLQNTNPNVVWLLNLMIMTLNGVFYNYVSSTYMGC